MDSQGADFLIVAIVGGLLGMCELLSRYRDEPWRAIYNIPAIVYVLINAVAATLALWLLNVLEPRFGLDPVKDADKLRLTWILVGGLGAMAFFRSSFFIFRVGDKDVPLGPSLIMQVLLDVTDRAVDRGRAAPRGMFVSDIMNGIDYDKASLALPAYCFALMQNVTQQEQSTIGQQVNALKSSTMIPEIKIYLLGLVLLNIVGEEVLKEAVKNLRAHLAIGSAVPAPLPAPPPPVAAAILQVPHPPVAAPQAPAAAPPVTAPKGPAARATSKRRGGKPKARPK